MTKEVPVVPRAMNAVCASKMEDTAVSQILMSQAPLSHDRHRGILAAGVLGAIPPRISRPLTCVRQRPTVRCQLKSKQRRSRTSSMPRGTDPVTCKSTPYCCVQYCSLIQCTKLSEVGHLFWTKLDQLPQRSDGAMLFPARIRE